MSTTITTTTSVTIIGPCSHGDTFRVHATGCADIKRDCRTYGDYDPMKASVSSKREVAGFIYGPASGSFYEEAGGDAENGSLDNYLDHCVSDFHFAPCVKGLR